MRSLTSHKVNGLNEELDILVLDSPGSGGAHHVYEISSEDDTEAYCKINFQNGPVGEVGINGISNESLLAVVEDRIQCFQSGPFACRENAVALTKLQECLMWLQKRTRDRVTRGVEGTSQK